MDITSAFPSSWLKAGDLNGKSWRMQIRACAIEDIGDDRKPVLHFERTEKGLVLNKTNATAIAAAYGNNTDGWVGKPVDVYPDMTMYQGRPTPCIRIKPVLQHAAPAPMQPMAQPNLATMQAMPIPATPGELLDDEVPF